MPRDRETDRKNETSELKWGALGSAPAAFSGRLTLEDISHRFDKNPVLDHVSLDVAPGKILCLLGPSGCGKTTLLRIAAGIEQPSSGRVLIDGREVTGPDVFVPPERRSVGLMFQNFALFPHLNILENVAFGLNNLSREEARQVARSALDRVGLTRYEQDYPHILSGGEQQRVALARALAPRPAVLLMDEPFSGLDKRLRENMRIETHAILHETRITCIMVTHQSEEAMRMGDEIAVMREGRIVQKGTASGLYYNPKNVFVARMFSEINEIPCRVDGDVVSTVLGDFPANGLLDKNGATLCLRQRGINLAKPGKGRSGRVLDIHFLGDAALLQVAVEGLEKPLLVRVEGAVIPGRGTDVGITVDSESVLVFDEDPKR